MHRTWLWRLLVAPPLVVGVGLCGLLGFHSRGMSWPDSAYYTLDLFAGSYTVPPGGTSVALQVARFTALAVTFAGLIALLLAVFRDASDLVAALFARGHNCVVGSGARAEMLISSLIAAGRKVIVFGEATTVETTARLRARGVRVVRRDLAETAWVRTVLRGATRAIAATDEDLQNAVVLRQLRNVAPAATQCLAWVEDLALCEIFREGAGYGGRGTRSRDDFFSRFENTAQDLARTLLADAHDTNRMQSRVAVIGANEFALALIIQLRRQSAAAPLAAHRVDVNLIDVAASSVAETWVVDWPELCNDANWRIRAVDSTTATTAEIRRAMMATRAKTFDRVFVTGEPTPQLLHAARDLSTQFATTVRAKPAAPLPTPPPPGSISAVDPDVNGLSPDLLEEDVDALLARAAHLWYLAGPGVQTADDWEHLDPFLRADNIDQAQKLRGWLLDEGYELRRRRELLAPVRLSDDLVQRLAVREHDRWMEFRRDHGWQRGERDSLKRRHPNMVPWDELSDDDRNKDRDALHRFPMIVRSVGYELVPRGETLGRAVPAG